MRSVALGLPRHTAAKVIEKLIRKFRCALWRWGFRDTRRGDTTRTEGLTFRCALWRWGFRDAVYGESQAAVPKYSFDALCGAGASATSRKTGCATRAAPESFRCALWRWGFRDQSKKVRYQQLAECVSMRSVALGLPRPRRYDLRFRSMRNQCPGLPFRCALWRWGFRDADVDEHQAERSESRFRCALWRWGFRDSHSISCLLTCANTPCFHTSPKIAEVVS